MQKYYQEFKSKGAEVVAISFAEPERVKEYLSHSPSPFPVLSDPDRKGYHAFGFGKKSLLRLLTPKVAYDYARLIVSGKRVKAPAEDPNQLGGDVILGKDDKVIYTYSSQNPSDRPSVEELLARL